MKRFLTAILFSAATTVAMAQPATAPAGDSSNNAVSPSSDNNTAQPAAGANSFTEDQARSTSPSTIKATCSASKSELTGRPYKE